jgi:cell wall-associated NlpC family hydrolase
MNAPTQTARAEIPADLLPVYMAASVICPGLPWPVLAAIGWVESHHASGHADPHSGDVVPHIIGPTLDGQNGFAAIRDAAQPDGWAHALGPMQFLSTTWATWGRLAPDRPPEASPNTQNAWDSIYSAAAYLCGGRATLDDLHDAVLRYNHSESYFEQVMAKATEYGLGSGPSTDATTLHGSGDAVVAAAMTQLGVPYVWGGETPGVGFDCSGLVLWAYAQIGVALPRTTTEQVLVGIPITNVDDLRPGDLIFTRSVRNGEVIDLGHVAIYAGGGMEIVAPKTGDVVSLKPVAFGVVQAARRVLA